MIISYSGRAKGGPREWKVGPRGAKGGQGRAKGGPREWKGGPRTEGREGRLRGSL